jgi:hypothetical protein
METVDPTRWVHLIRKDAEVKDVIVNKQSNQISISLYYIQSAENKERTRRSNPCWFRAIFDIKLETSVGRVKGGGLTMKTNETIQSNESVSPLGHFGAMRSTNSLWCFFFCGGWILIFSWLQLLTCWFSGLFTISHSLLLVARGQPTTAVELTS